MEAKFGSLEKKGKNDCHQSDEIFQKNSRVNFFYYKMTGEIFGEFKIETVDEKLRRCKSN